MSEAGDTGRTRLDRDAVVAAATNLAESQGLDALSMRSLSAHLSVVPMALYRHVADKEDLLGAMVDAVVAQWSAPTAGGTWRERVRAYILTARASVEAHPWLVPAIQSRTRRTEAAMGHMNAIAGEFLNGGVSADLTHYAMHALGTRIWGFSTEAFEDADAPSTADANNPAVVAYMTARFPHVVTIAMDAAARRPGGACDQPTEFEFTLDLLLDGFERLHLAGWGSDNQP